LTIAQYRFVMEAGLRPRWHVQHPRPLRLPAEHLPWARERGERLAGELRSRGHPVVGDLSDLVPGPATCGADPTADIPDDELLVVAEAAVAALALAHGALFKRYRRAFFERQGRWPSPAEVMGSSCRAVGFWARKAALRGADQHRALAWAARTYVRRTSRVRSGA
jgi:hypothetical protein